VVSRTVNDFGNKSLLLSKQSRRIIVTEADSNAVWGLLKEVIS
jgi:hypothetical protein